MTEVDTRCYKLQLSSFDMPDDDAVRDIAGPLLLGQNSEDYDEIENDIFRQDRIFNEFDEAATDLTDTVKKHFYDEDGVRLEKCAEPISSLNNNEKAPIVCESTDIPVSYEVLGLKPHEMPVIGFHVDHRIMPGCKYRVRIIDNSSKTTSTRLPRYQFGGQALQLIRMGQGYGKRLTFTGDNLNNNPNYFWSDTDPSGYGFSIVAVEAGDEMELTDLARRPIGRGTVEEASPCQTEISSETLVNDGERTLIKRVSVIMKMRLRYTCERHGMRSMRADETVIVRGVAKVVKRAGDSKAYTKCIEQIELPIQGECLLYML